MKKIKIFFILFLSFLIIYLAVWVFSIFYLGKNNFGFLGGLNKGISEIQKIDFNELVEDIKKEVSAPPPLSVDKFGTGVLTKSGIIAETNFYRQKNGLPLLKENDKLNAAAMEKAKDLFKNQYFAHVSPDGIGPADLIKKYGYEYILAGENLILGSFSGDKEAVDAWMNSPEHRANILNPKYTEIGVAVLKGNYKGDEVWIGVQEFASSLSLCPQPNPVLKNTINNYQKELNKLATEIEAKKAEIEAINPRKNYETYKSLVFEYNEMVEEYNFYFKHH